MIKIYTDGSCRKDGGGHGVVAIKDGQIEYVYQRQTKEETTNNREEMKAIIFAIEKMVTLFPNDDCLILSDSAYCVNMFNDWIYKWSKNDWKNSKKKTVENLDLVLTLYKYCNIKNLNFQVKWLKGHDNNIGNELADALATADANKIKKILKENTNKYLPKILSSV